MRALCSFTRPIGLRLWLVLGSVACTPAAQPPPESAASASLSNAESGSTANVQGGSNPEAAPEIGSGAEPTPANAEPTEASAPGADEGSTAALPAEAVAEPAPAGASDARCEQAPAGMQCVPPGWYVRGIHDDSHGCEQMGQPRDLHPMAAPAARVWLDAFYIDETEVTFGAYMACVRAGECELTRPLYRGFSGDDQPMTGVSWFHARDYCNALGKRLPTEAEWEAAARGPDGEWYAWGNDEPSCDLAVLEDDRGRSCGVPQPSDTPDRGRIQPVRSRPAGRFGLYDMTGNVEEWVADWWTRDYAECGDACTGVNPQGPCASADECENHHFRVVKGGSWYWRGDHAAGWHRRRHEPDNDPFHHFGFRCVVRIADAGGVRPEFVSVE
jgi:formylglycine-generating enzyme required for sulfatase activity